MLYLKWSVHWKYVYSMTPSRNRVGRAWKSFISRKRQELPGLFGLLQELCIYGLSFFICHFRAVTMTVWRPGMPEDGLPVPSSVAARTSSKTKKNNDGSVQAKKTFARENEHCAQWPRWHTNLKRIRCQSTFDSVEVDNGKHYIFFNYVALFSYQLNYRKFFWHLYCKVNAIYIHITRFPVTSYYVLLMQTKYSNFTYFLAARRARFCFYV